jgi:Lrp/AsnC family transcriptional regulator, regulator for asnA, asnC and gidA
VEVSNKNKKGVTHRAIKMTITNLQLETKIVSNHTKNPALHEKSGIKMGMDIVDAQILSLLHEDCRLSNRRLSKIMQMSSAAVVSRIKNLEAKGIIKGYAAVLDSVKLGYDLTALIMIRAEGEHLCELESALTTIDNIIALYEVTGDFDLIAVVKLKDRGSLNVMIKNLLVTPAVKRTVTNITLNIVKEDFDVSL